MEHTQSGMFYLRRFESLSSGGDEFDLRQVVEGATPDHAAELIYVMRRYARFRRLAGELADFEEFRRALPWLFECEELLRTAVEAVLESAVLLGRDHFAVAKSLSRAHPLAVAAIETAMRRWENDATARGPGGGRTLPADFGPASMDGSPRYHLLARLGSGPNGEVYEAIDRETYISEPSASVAVKIFHRRVGPSRDRTGSYQENLRQAVGPGVCQYVDAGVAPSGEEYLVSRLALRCTPLQAGPARGRAAIREAVRRTIQIATALEPIHAVGVTHGWLKPTNVLVDPSGAIVLTDLGLCRMNPESLDATGCYSDRAGLAFAAPELLAEHASPTPAADVYGLGAMLYWLLSGDLPNGAHARDAHALLMDRIPCERRLPPAVPSDLATICYRAMAIEPRDRWCSVSEMRNLLEIWLTGRPVPGVTTGWLFRRKRAVRALPAAAVCAACSLGAVAVGGSVTGSAWTDRMAALQADFEHRERLANERATMAEERATGIERMSRENTRSTLEAIRIWKDTLITSPDDAGASTLLLEVVARSPLATDHVRDDLLPHSAQVARRKADSTQNDQTIEALIWQLMAGFKLMEVGDGDYTEYLTRARAMLASITDPSDPWLAIIDDALNREPGTSPD